MERHDQDKEALVGACRKMETIVSWRFLPTMDGDLAIKFVANILYHPNCLVLIFFYATIQVLVIIRLYLRVNR
jgi:hypothetical protein